MFHSILFADDIKYKYEIFFFQLGRGTSSEINGFYIFSFQVFFSHFQFTAKGTYITCLQFAAGSGIEIAIDAAGFAKGNMKINTCHNCIV